MNDDKLMGALRAAANREQGERRPAALEAPLGEDFEARVTAQILAAQRLARRTQPAASTAPGRVVMRLRARPAPVVALGLLAAAAALLLALSRPWTARDTSELPLYAMTVTGGQDTTRGAPDDSSRPIAVTADAPLAVLLRPPTEVSGPLVVRLFTSRGGRASEAHAAVRAAPSGAVEVRGAARDLAGDAPGEATLVVVIAREAARVDARAVAEGAPAPRGVAVTRIALRVLP